MKEKKGFTLAELIVFLALLGVVLAIGYRLFFLGQNTFTRGSDRFELQSEMRSAGDFLLDELRNAVEVEILDAPTDEADYHYIYLDGSRIVHKYNGSTKVITLPIIRDEDLFTLKKDSGNKNFLGIRMTGIRNGNTYDLSTEVFLKNIANLDPDSGKVIKYKKPSDQ